jgi:hypothetical protein
MTRYWFRPKRFGYGATPVRWQGWVATFGFAAVLVALWFVVMRPVPGSAPDFWRVTLWLAVLAAAAVGFSLFARSKTDGEWKWRWGDRN